MQYFDEATLIYVGQGQKTNGSPLELTISRTAKVKVIRNFSLNYYNVTGTATRSMRNSRNFVVDKDRIEDIVEDGKRYELLYVVYKGIKYRIREILNYYKTGMRYILDTQEVSS